jgi:hypothetical protein
MAEEGPCNTVARKRQDARIIRKDVLVKTPCVYHPCAAVMKSLPSPLKIAKPCPKRWEELSGDSKCRFCEHCQLHVHNLSAMTEHERGRFLVERTGERTCVRYALRPDETIVSDGSWIRMFRPLLRLRFGTVTVLATLLPFWFSACASRRTAGKPLPPVDNKTLAGDSGKSGVSGKEGYDEVMGEFCYFPSDAGGSEAFPARWRPGSGRGWGLPPGESPGFRDP